MTTAAVVLFWTSAALLAYTHLGYPLLMRAWAALRPPPGRRPPCEPEVSVAVVASDEAERIAARIENLLALDYPRELLEIIVASDGSTDGTVARARAFEGRGVRVIHFGARRGKPAVLNDIVPRARGAIVVLADARQTFDRQAVRRLVAPFAEARVGAVSGELVLLPGTGGAIPGAGARGYWRYEKFIRRNESRVDSTIGATGAICAIRRDLFEPIPEDTLLDDVLIPMRITARGFRVLFEAEARAYDRVFERAGQEFSRKVRTIAGNFQILARERWLLDPRRNRLWFQTLSHKALRLLGPLLLLGALAANLALLDRPSYRLTLAAQAAFYIAALTGHLLRGTRGARPLLSVPYIVCLLSWATVIGFLRFATRRQGVTWQRASAA
jgi:poly-beta-1,6-N-acetyl-D-glucosamine synthase